MYVYAFRLVLVWLLASLHGVTSISISQSAQENQRDDVFNMIFGGNWTQLNYGKRGEYRVPEGQCTSLTVLYGKYIEQAPGVKVFRVPHSRIYANGFQCGRLPANASEDDLWLVSHRAESLRMFTELMGSKMLTFPF
jgi:hypothetical protein